MGVATHNVTKLQGYGMRLALFGGNWNSTATAGLSCWVLSNVASSSGVAIGGRLVKKPL